MTTDPQNAAINEARAEALAAMNDVTKAQQAADTARANRDAAILKMAAAGRPIPDIARDLNLPPSTVRQSMKSAIVRAKTNS